MTGSEANGRSTPISQYLSPKLFRWRQKIIWGTAGQAKMGRFGRRFNNINLVGRLHSAFGGLWIQRRGIRKGSIRSAPEEAGTYNS